MTKEEVYDSQVNPLMAQIIAICKEHKIPLLASFTLDRDEGLACTTFLLEDEYEPHENLLEAARVIYNGRSRSPMKITTKNGDGEITRIDVVY